ncbi:membrane associated peptidase [Clostridium polyendosporum]|uniref:Membrane associated peptidase n=1 Tax=Clostridium polyendosporum TaxID=69208 RepID=A0A919RXS3_9CLOT|nr:rhomboid family intramembrane serine protease [Clostridium polyendosporum]GIM27493.1 membrane associated peptidase [Clostridium polyendosporum]
MKISEKNLFDALIKEHGFVIEQYYCKELNENRWIALKYTESGIYAVICSEEEEEFYNAKGADDFLRNKGKNYELNNIIAVSHEYRDLTNSGSYKRIIFDKISNRVLQYESSTEFIVKVISSLGEEKRSTNSYEASSKITLILILVNAIIFITSVFLSGSLFDIDLGVLVFLGAKVNFLIERGQYYRLLTAMFLHGGLLHIAFNMYALYSLGNLTEQIYGKIKYLSIYFISGIFSTYVSYLFSSAVSVGASGAIFGLLGATLVFGLKEKNRIGKGFLTNIISVVVLNIMIGLTTPNIDNFGHFGGLIGGIVMAIFLRRE